MKRSMPLRCLRNRIAEGARGEALVMQPVRQLCSLYGGDRSEYCAHIFQPAD